MEIKLTLALPRDAVSVPVVRRILTRSMDVLGVSKATTSDIEVALTEACSNVLNHAQAGDEYEVSAGIDGEFCVIEVVDRGDGFDSEVKGLAEADGSAESGRGIQLMRALVDRVEFTSNPRQGTVVHMEKRLTWDDGAVLRQLTEGQPEPQHGPWSDHEQMADAPEPH